MVRITNSLSKRIHKELIILNIKKTFKYNELLGCSLEEFKTYLLNKFTENMNFDNYGKWEIDHIIPVSFFDFKDDEELKLCCHCTNLQPLWKIENKEKSNKL